MIKNDFQHLLGKSKAELLEELGQDFNYYPSEIWTYTLHTNFFGRKILLLLFFENDVVKIIKSKNIMVKSIPFYKDISNWKNS